MDLVKPEYCAMFMGDDGCTGNKYLLANCEKTCGTCDAYNDDAKCKLLSFYSAEC